jgi:hypothetical protein
MDAQEKIKLLEKQTELLEKIVELQRQSAPVPYLQPYTPPYQPYKPYKPSNPWTSPLIYPSVTYSSGAN